MKKVSLCVAIALVIGAGAAFASSLAVPWFVDNSPAAAGYPPSSGTTALIYLKSNVEDDVVCDIVYYAADGTKLEFAEGVSNTFVVPAQSTVAFRPVAFDPYTTAGGQEDPSTGALVPDRPRTVNTGKNGSLTVSYQGGPQDIQGMMIQVGGGGLSYAHLLPPGKSD